MRRKDLLICILCIIAAAAILFLFMHLDREVDVDPQITPTTTTKPPEPVVDRVALPETIYAVVGKPVVIRFLNITGYNSLEDISVSVETDGKGKIYDDRWEYTPESAESFKISFKVTDKQGVLVNESTHTIQVKESQQKELSVLVIGDSTIAGGYETKRVLDLSNADGHDLTLLGSKTTSYVNDKNNRHEGRNGWKVITYASAIKSDTTKEINPFYNPETSSFDFEYYMKQQGYSSVDCVCLQLGINDIFGAKTDSAMRSKPYIMAYFEYVDMMIASIHEYDANIKIIWNLILPGSVEQEKFEQQYKEKQTADRYKRNTYVANLEIINHVQGMENVYVAPTNAPLNTAKNMYAGGVGAVIPTKTGYFDVGTMLYGHIIAITD